MIYDLVILVQFQLDLITNIYLLLASVCCISIIYCLFNYNPMYSLLFFILFLFHFVLSLFLQNYEFIALLIGLIYFGAILILFFFLLLLINLQIVIRDNYHMKRITFSILPLGGLTIFLVKLGHSYGLFTCNLALYNSQALTASFLTIESLSFLLFSNWGVGVIIVGLILFIALIGIVTILVSNKTLALTFRKSI